MRPQKVENKEILEGLFTVFRSKGYDGASLNELAKATGLKKASLYHRFPGGKSEMTQEVLTFIEELVFHKIYSILNNEELEPKKRLSKVLKNIELIYNGGKNDCIYRSLSMDVSISSFGDLIKKGVEQWISAFKTLGMALKMDENEAEEMANQTFIDIQGSLVLSKSLGNIKPFSNAIKRIENRYKT